MSESVLNRKISYRGFFIGLGIFIYLILFFWQIVIANEESRIKHETYISSLYDSYTRNLEECRSSVLKSVESQPQDIKDKAVRESCITPINQSRNAQLLKEWGYESLLSNK